MGLFDIFKRRQKRALPSNLHDPALIALFGGGFETAAGIDMTEAVALGSAGVWAAVKTNSETAAMLPKHVFQRLENGEKKRDTQHAVSRVIHVQANPVQTAYDFWVVFFANLQLRGSAYAQIVRDAGGEVSALWPIPSKFVEVSRHGDALLFEVRTKGGGKKFIPQAEMLHVAGFRIDGWQGLNPVQVGKDSIGLGVGMERYGSKFFANGGRLSGILNLIGSLSKERKAEIASQFQDKFGGVDNAHKTWVAEEGEGYTPIGSAPNEGQLLEGRTFQIQEAARQFSSTSSRLNEHSRSTFSNIEQQNIEYVQYSLQPSITGVESAINTQLFTREEQDGFFVEFNVDALLRGDTASRFAAYASAIQHGWMSRNEVRDKENLNPFDGGDTMLAPVNMQPVNLMLDGDGLAPAQDGDPDTRAMPEGEGRARLAFGHTLTRAERARVEDTIEPRRALRRLGRKTIEEAARRLVRAELREVRALIKKHLGRRGVADLTLALEEFYGARGEMPALLRKILGPVFDAYAAEISAAATSEHGGDDVPSLGDFVETYTDNMSDRHTSSRLAQLLGIIRDANPEDTAETLEQRLEEWEATSAAKIAEREAVQLAEAAAGLTFAGLGVTLFLWVASSNACPLCMEIDGRVVGREEVFVNKGDDVSPDGVSPLTPKTSIAHPPLHQGCDCTLAST